jgi:hypothetical protein
MTVRPREEDFLSLSRETGDGSGSRDIPASFNNFTKFEDIIPIWKLNLTKKKIILLFEQIL